MKVRTRIDLAIVILIAFLIVVGISFLFQCTQSHYKNFVRGKNYFHQSKYEQALPYLAAAFEIKPENLKTAKYLAWTYDKLGNINEVENVLQVMSQINPHDLNMTKWFADTYYTLADYAKAEELYRKILSDTNDQFIKRKLAEVLTWQKKYDQAITILEQLTILTPDDYELLEFLADVYSWHKEYDKAINTYKELLQVKHLPKQKSIMLKLAEVLRYVGSDAEAIKLYNQYMKE